MPGRACGKSALAALLPLLLAACNAEPAKVETVREDNPGQPAASVPIINQSIGNSQNAAEADSPPPPPAPAPRRQPAPVPAPAERYRAIGTEPFWAVTVKGSTALLERPDKPPRSFAVSRNGDERAIRYLGEGFAMTITPGPCSDGMSDAIWSDQVSVAFGEGTLNGCGGDRQDPEDEPL
ncbi:hypothetical protein L288_11420 [Sphingobium quisquiliarum P25]|uniref:DUF306 domain-containing protein n=1 Tax=Sphingobium quisquiliarum P25 TaxID=1329909 RepID=T0GQ62_9SPHN|nr:hypothetical protein [Sphingobium quisquiliarum]EQB06066.1 hypothetical protein L288_11420 [Sphingobium quisquiliarum P25]